MDVFTATGAALRRWYVTLPVLALAGVFAAQQYTSATSTYEATASLVVLAPPQPEPAPSTPGQPPSPAPENPLVSGGGGPRLLIALVTQNMNSTPVRRRVAEQGGTASYATSSRSELPFVAVSVVGTDAESVTRTLELAVDETAEVLRDVQTDLGADPAALYTSELSAPPEQAVEVPAERNRAVIAIAVGGLALAVTLAILLDNALAANRARRRRRQAPSGSAAPADDAAATASAAPLTAPVAPAATPAPAPPPAAPTPAPPPAAAPAPVPTRAAAPAPPAVARETRQAVLEDSPATGVSEPVPTAVRPWPGADDRPDPR